MSKPIRNVVWKLLNSVNLGGIVQLYINSAIKDDGWFKSYKTKQAVNKNGEPIPWCTYPFTKFIEPRLNKNLTAFEYGSGNSTLWFSKRIKNITSVENDKGWYDLVKTKLPGNCKIIYHKLEYHSDYAKEISNHNTKFDIVIIDGRDRNYCAELAPQYLSDNGVIFFDNANLKNYELGVSGLLNKGFKKLDFWGISPVTAHSTCTCIFYRTNNCLNI